MIQPTDTGKQLREHHAQTLWMYWTLVVLGCWMLLMPTTFSYHKGLTEINETRNLWLDLPSRISALEWSDRISGLLLIFFGFRSVRPNHPVSLWVCCLVGVWLNAAPLVFWSPVPLVYANDTLVGVLVISFSVLTPGMPNMTAYMKMGAEVPSGWSYNPSSWDQRWVMIVLGFAGWMVSRYLGAWQLGFIDKAWDPFFGDGTRKVLNSAMSRSWPISDGALGAFAYTFEFLMGWMGGPARWRTMPWMVTFFGILVIPLGLVHIFLVMSQPVAVGSWCTFCLLAATIMLPMLPLEVDEVIAAGILGVVLLFAPGFWHIRIDTMAAHIFHISGALVVVCSVISMAEVVRVVRYANWPAGLAVAILPWFFHGGLAPGLTGAVCGTLICIFSISRGRIHETYGFWQRYIR
ncbi:MAG TPA: vitamin K epoxide reductase family protein [Puia sp.]|uniref:vitamin K epoxide reductase family protein n=1 Tax=Puia sp. TaxID=2045100 RepID=UPI002BC4089D|nr:vitamin K epoxide reductase family protein [Puia sp.]HVU94258.1 vitamin K epoxide reductase family protein [Puia sp.]